MNPGIVIPILGLTVIVATFVWGRAMNGKPRAFWVLMGLCVVSGVWRTATNGVLTGAWLMNALGLICGLIAITMFSARHSR